MDSVTRTLSWTLSNGIGVLALNTPPSNAMTGLFFRELAEWTERVRELSGLKGIIIRGTGRHFSSGADLGDLLSDLGFTTPETGGMDPAKESVLLRNYEAIVGIAHLSVPVVAMIRGVCLGSAFELALHCHFRLCTEDAVFGLPEATYNLMPGLGGIRKIAELAGPANALRLSLHGTTFGARDALELGLVDAILPKKELEDAAHDLIHHCGPSFHPLKRTLYLNRYLTAHGIAKE